MNIQDIIEGTGLRIEQNSSGKWAYFYTVGGTEYACLQDYKTELEAFQEFLKRSVGKPPSKSAPQKAYIP